MRQADQSVSGGGIAQTFLANSITLLVVPTTPRVVLPNKEYLPLTRK